LPSCSNAAPCSGSIAVYPIAAASGSTQGGTLGAPVPNGNLNYWPLTLPSRPNDVILPTAVNVLASGADVFVTAYDTSVSPSVGYIFGFAVGSGGALTPLNGGVPGPAGEQPSAVASDPTSTFLYVTDYVHGAVLGYTVASGSVSVMPGSPFPAGDEPSAIVVDSKYPYVYVANSLDSSVTAYSNSHGPLVPLGTYSTGSQPVAIGIDPSTSHFLYTANYLGGSVSGFELSSTAGTLLNTQNSPYTANAQPTAVAAIPHGSSKQ